MPPGDDLLATLEAERAILRTFLRFFRLADTLRWEEIAGACFTPSAVIEYRTLPDGSSQRFEGREQINAYLLENSKPWAQIDAHVVGQHIVEWDGSRPRLTAYVTAWHWFNQNAAEGDLRPADWTAIGLVEDDYEVVDGTWLIAHRSVSPVAGQVATGQLPGTAVVR